MHAQNTFPDHTVWIFYILFFCHCHKCNFCCYLLAFYNSLRILITFSRLLLNSEADTLPFFSQHSAIISTCNRLAFRGFGHFNSASFLRASLTVPSRQLLFINAMFLPNTSRLQGKCLSREEHFRLKRPKRIDLEHVNHLFANITSFVPSSSSVAFIAIWQQELLLSIFKCRFICVTHQSFAVICRYHCGWHCECLLKKEIDMGQVIFILLFTTLFTKQKEFRQNEARVLIYHSGRSKQERYQNNIRTRAYREAPKLTWKSIFPCFFVLRLFWPSQLAWDYKSRGHPPKSYVKNILNFPRRSFWQSYRFQHNRFQLTIVSNLLYQTVWCWDIFIPYFNELYSWRTV